MKVMKKGLLGLFVLVILIMLLPESGQAEEKVIKIGYDANSHFILEEDGEFYGYGVEYLEKISEYTGWEYEYVKVENWKVAFDKLRNNDIDLICTAHYTEERAQEFIYSDIPFGYESTLLYTNENSDISYQEYSAFNGCKVGLLTESYSAEDFINYATQNNVEYDPVYYSSKAEMCQAVENNEIDLMAIGSRYGTADLQLVDRLAVNAFYCISNPTQKLLIEEIENILQQIMFDDPVFEGKLNQKYFGHDALSHTPPYTEEELSFIENLGTVKVKMLLNQKPSWYEEDGKIEGIWAEYLNVISEKSGIKFEMENGIYDEESENIYEELLAQNYLVLRTSKSMEHNNTEGMLLSSPLMDIEIAYIERQKSFVNDDFSEKVIAVASELAYVEPLLLAENPTYQFEYYSDSESCLEAVKEQKASMAIVTALRASYLMQKPEYVDKLIQVPGVDYNNQIHIVANENQEQLISIINKAIRHISQEEKEEIIAKELLMNSYELGFDDVWYQSWEWIVGIICLVVILLIVYSIMTQKIAGLRIEKKEYELLQKKTQLDEVTGLYNRTYFYEMAKEMLDNAQEEMCIVVMDICHFKIVNELYGIHAGDTLLQEIAVYFKEFEAKHPMITARFMADHYYICMPKRVFEEGILPKSFKTSLEGVDVHVVYGVFWVDKNEETPINVMCDRAGLAVHGKSFAYTEYIHFYDHKEHKQLMLEQELEKEMEKALKERQFYIVIQPKYDPNTESIVGGETLVRWQHPIKGFMSPGDFIPIFEKNGFIIQLDYFVWEETCRLISKRKKEGKKNVPISVNVSRAHFYGCELMNKLQKLVTKYELDTKDLELEITESLCGEGADEIYSKIHELREHGFKIAMDDFGSGYSSLNMLKEMHLDILKMDLKFLEGDGEKSHLILKSLIEMAQAMELKVVVEGVEELEQVEFLSQFKGCILQGYYYSRPIKIEEFEEKLEESIKM